MVRCFLVLFAAGFVSEAFCLQGSCGREQKPVQEPVSPEGAEGCGCEKLRRAAAQGRTASDDPAGKYSTAANEVRTGVKHEEEKKLQNPVCDSTFSIFVCSFPDTVYQSFCFLFCTLSSFHYFYVQSVHLSVVYIVCRFLINLKFSLRKIEGCVLIDGVDIWRRVQDGNR